MATARAMHVAIVAVLTITATLAEAAPKGPKHRLVARSGPVSPGERVTLEVVPPLPGFSTTTPKSPRSAPQYRYAWRITTGPGSISRDGVYSAPYIVARGQEAVLIELLVKNDAGKLDTLVRDEMRIRPGVFPGADSCLGPGQSFEDFELSELEELPRPLTSVQADYPASARARRAQANFVVRAIVCRNGRVLDGYAVWPVDAVPDPVLERAAVEAALQWTFEPGASGGNPVATVVDIPFVFKP